MNNIDPIKPLEESEEINQYYEKVLAKARTLFKNKKTSQEAIELLTTELDQPYTPIKYLDEFSELLTQFETEVKINQLEEKEKNLNLNKLLKNAIMNNQFDPAIFEHFVRKDPDLLNDSQTQKLVELFLLNELISNIDKLFVIDLMDQYSIDKEFVFLNAKTLAKVKINPLFFTQNFQTKDHKITTDLINEATFKDPALNKFATDILLHCITYYYPSFGFESPQALKNAILYHVKVMLGLEEPKLDLDPTEMKLEEILNTL